MTVAARKSWTVDNIAGYFVAWLKKAFCLLMSFILPGIANAAFSFNFPEPVTPIARDGGAK